MPTIPSCPCHPWLARSHPYSASGALGGTPDNRRWKRGQWLWCHGLQTWMFPLLLVFLYLTDPDYSHPGGETKIQNRRKIFFLKVTNTTTNISTTCMTTLQLFILCSPLLVWCLNLGSTLKSPMLLQWSKVTSSDITLRTLARRRMSRKSMYLLFRVWATSFSSFSASLLFFMIFPSKDKTIDEYLQTYYSNMATCNMTIY